MSITDMCEMENLIGEVVDCFEEKMKTLYEEEPEMFKRQPLPRGVACAFSRALATMQFARRITPPRVASWTRVMSSEASRW